MPLGASRVAGNWPDYESFRHYLWKDLIENDWSFDFIGTREDGAIYPLVDSTFFDPDHEGVGGHTSDEILVGLFTWLRETGAPDVVLFSSPGGNDILNREPTESIVNNIQGIIDILQKVNPNIGLADFLQHVL